VTAGTLEVDNTLTSSAVTVGAGGTLQGTGTLSGTLSVTGTGVVSPGSSGTGALTAGNTTISGHLAVNVNDTAHTELMSDGTLDLTGGTVDLSVGGDGFTQSYYVIAAASSITGSLPSVSTTGYTLTNTGTELRLSQTPTNSFTAWVAGYPTLTDTTPTGNPSHDGISNLVKYALGLDPTKSAQPAGSVSSGTLTFNKGTMAQGDSNLAYSIEESPDLVTWTTQSGPSVSNGPTAITYTFPTGQAKVFARLKVIQKP